MKFINLKAAVVVLALSTALAGTAQAQVVGDSSNWSNVDIGASTVNGGPHVAGRVGIGVPNTGLSTRIDFQGLQGILGTDGNGVTTFINTTAAETDHSQYGRFDFAKVGSYDVYFGEWSQTGNVTGSTHSVYYGGTGATADANVPLSGTANYTVKGINNYAGTSTPLTGTFAADFGAGTVTGSIQNAALRVDIGTADIIGSTIDGVGTATASNPTTSATLASGGNVSGQFFGSAAQALAGIATFGSSRQYDTAFGGTQ
ncbi:MAG TPA: Slam-dependent surface lipoprotein [Sphingobium sp.]